MGSERRTAAKGGRARKDSRNFACQMDSGVFDRLDAYCAMSRQSKTVVVELALKEYFDAHYDSMASLMGYSGKQQAVADED